MRIDLTDPRARWAFLIVVFLSSLGFTYLAGKAWLAESLGASANPQRWQAAERLEPGNALYAERIGLFEEWDLENRNLSQAIGDLRRAVQIDPWSAQFHGELASAYELQGNFAGAQKEYESTKAAYPESADVAWRYGSFLLRQDKVSAGFGEIRTALEIDPSLTFSGIAECFATDPDAGRILDEALPRTSEAYLTDLNYFVSQGQIDAAAIVWNRVLGLGESFPMKQVIPFVDALIQENRISKAKKVWDQALVATNWPRDPAMDGSVVFNGGFENEIAGGGFDWREIQQTGITFSIDKSIAHSGQRSLRIDFDGSQNLNFQHLYQYVAVEPLHRYRFSSFLKTENITTDSGLRFEIVDPLHPVALSVFTSDITGSAPWTEVQAQVRAGRDASLLEIFLRRLPSESLDNKLSGTVWVDDVSLKPVATEGQSRSK